MHKTGTTYLQHVIRKFRKQLLEHDGLLIPESGFPQTKDVSPKPGGLPGHNEFARGSRREAAIKNLAREVSESNPKRVLISAENLSLKCPEFAVTLVEGLELIGSVSIVLVVRRQDKWIDSYYRQCVAGNIRGETRDFRTFVSEEGTRLLDYGVRYEHWQQAGFSGRLLVASYDDLIVDNRLLNWFAEMLQATSLLSTHCVEQTFTYPSLTRLDAEITRLVNMVSDIEGDVRNDLLSRVYGIGELPDAPFVSEDLYDELRRCYEPKNKQLAEEWGMHPATEFSNWRRTTKQGEWDRNLHTISCKLTATLEGLDAHFQAADRKRRPFDTLVAKLSQIRLGGTKN